MTAGLQVGDRVEVEVGPIAHGGHCVARHEGQVLFVRHTLPGERVVAQVTEVGSGGRFVRADAVEVRTAAPDGFPPRVCMPRAAAAATSSTSIWRPSGS